MPLLCAIVATACAKDRILPVDSVCGDLKKTGTEQCDVASEGCVECRIVDGWTCTDQDCTSACGDSVAVGEEECDPPDGITCDSSCHAGVKSEACDMTGYWIIRETDFSIDTIVSQVQTSSNWYVVKLSQVGESFEVNRAINCGIRVTGSVTVELTAAGVRGLIHENPQDSDSPRGPRRGTFTPGGTGCAFALDRNYMVRGGDPSLLPADFTTNPDLSTLPPLPSESDPENPTMTDVALAVDTDGDGRPGVAFQISGNLTGVRNVVQRDWNEYFTLADRPIPTNAIELVAGVRFDNQENVLSVSDCPAESCSLLAAGSYPAMNLQDRVTFLYLGKDLTDPRVSRIIETELKTNVDGDLRTCENAYGALPHDASMQ